MYFSLAIVASVVGLLVTGIATYTAWFVHHHLKKQRKQQPDLRAADVVGSLLLRWSSIDYAVLLLFLFGMVFLLADFVSMLRERESYPFFHYGYLLCGIAFSFLGMLFMMVRLGVVLRLARVGRESVSDDHHKPEQTDDSK